MLSQKRMREGWNFILFSQQAVLRSSLTKVVYRYCFSSGGW